MVFLQVHSDLLKYYFWLALILLLSCTEVIKTDEIPFERMLENQKMPSEIFNVDIPYAVLLPAGYDKTTEAYPVVYLLHGYGDNEKSWYTAGNLQYFVDLYADDIAPMIYVMPNGYNTYYVDRYTGNYPYMEMLTKELVTTIDKRFRTINDKSARAVMGYSMGGFGALILPSLNPDVYSISVPLSMSFRTDEQYLKEPQGVFDNQWATVFGGRGLSGSARLTDYFKQHSPFHYFNVADAGKYNGLKILLDCGDDEETLSLTNDALHAIMRDNNIPHEYRVRNGGHSFDYWKKSYPEALMFISNAVRGIPHPSEPTPLVISPKINSKDYEQIDVSGVRISILKPINYSTSVSGYPVIYILNDSDAEHKSEDIINLFSLLRNEMTDGKLPQSILVEIPALENIDYSFLEEVVTRIGTELNAHTSVNKRLLLGNSHGGKLASEISSNESVLFTSYFLYDADLPDESISITHDFFYYLDRTDESRFYNGYYSFYKRIRENGNKYEYRVRQGSISNQSFLNGLRVSIASLTNRLS